MLFKSGTIYTVANEATALGVEALAFKVDLRDAKMIKSCVEATMERFGRIDILINNASALWWQEIKDTPVKKFDLITQINVRGTFLMTKFCLPHMEKNGFGRVVTMSPPIHVRGYTGRTAYNISKFGMTMVALGVSEEYAGKGITAFSLWPATVIESLASKNFKMGDPSLWRKATIISDATMGLVCEEDNEYTGRMLIDDEYLRERHGFTDADFVKYRYDPEVEPPRLLAMEGADGGQGMFIRRGAVKKLNQDMEKDKLVAKL